MFKVWSSLWLASIVFCSAASFYDVFERRVPNWLNACFFLVPFVASINSLESFAPFVLGCLALAYVLYRFKVWGAGDAKFFTVLCAFCFVFKGVSLAPATMLILSALLVFAYNLRDPAFVRRVARVSRKSLLESVAPASFLWLLPVWLVLPGAVLLWLVELPAVSTIAFLSAGLLFGLEGISLVVLFAAFFLLRFAFSLKGLKTRSLTFFAPFLSAAFFLAVLS
ncbi:hypothetical protein AUJ15_04140 [Candidatus Micrarchaeota archaeon CG1_02_55_41]|nr:MAG: hypothetical protein AUJ15_04140 [Candidatus Micrarchaeota archaeon CG1_02_55_41]